jgi:hypothetical protein
MTATINEVHSGTQLRNVILMFLEKSTRKSMCD